MGLFSCLLQTVLSKNNYSWSSSRRKKSRLALWRVSAKDLTVFNVLELFASPRQRRTRRQASVWAWDSVKVGLLCLRYV